MTLKFERIICIDPSLRCSGWAMFRVESRQLIGIGNVRALGSDELMPKRLLDLHTKIARLFSQLDLSTNDVLICEDTTTMIDPSSAIKVEQVRGTFETLARSAGINVPGRIHPRTVQHELLGLRGKQLERSHVKSLAVQAV
ncbi:MAG: crossover junction endodeoxyribonuclease RuvC, partial [Bdellovibrionales bacterium]|nr:crossover junction endodeoxyribonuclease RuvC [Bdellovibrionales bacterium]